MAAYLKQKPNTYIFVEGHCDEKGPQSYNLALGMRRANTVRNYLAEQGVNPNNIFTISYGKERPASLENSDSAHAANRRAQFKIYSR
jgi:peptidoglycan-associated lipoprotein